MFLPPYCYLVLFIGVFICDMFTQIVAFLWAERCFLIILPHVSIFFSRYVSWLEILCVSGMINCQNESNSNGFGTPLELLCFRKLVVPSFYLIHMLKRFSECHRRLIYTAVKVSIFKKCLSFQYSFLHISITCLLYLCLKELCRNVVTAGNIIPF